MSATTRKGYRRTVVTSSTAAASLAARSRRHAEDLEADGQVASAGAARAAERSARRAYRYLRTVEQNLEAGA